MDVLLIFAIIALIWWATSAQAKKAKQKKERIEQERLAEKVRSQTAEACAYVAKVNSARAFPVVWMKNVNSQDGEFGLLGESSTLFETKSKSFRLGAATRLNIGKMPLYLGASQPFTYEDHVAAGTGDLYLSNKRIIFLSDKRSATVPLKDVIGLDTSLDTITIHSGKRQKPIIFTVSNPAIWSLLIKVISRDELDTPNLPDGMTLHAEPTETPGEVNFSAHRVKIEVTAPSMQDA